MFDCPRAAGLCLLSTQCRLEPRPAIKSHRPDSWVNALDESHAPRRSPDPAPRGPLLPARRLPHRPGAPGRPRARHPRPLRPRHRRPRRRPRHRRDPRHHGDPHGRGLRRRDPGRRLRRAHPPRRHHRQLPPRRPRPRLRPDRRRGPRPAGSSPPATTSAPPTPPAPPSSPSPATSSSPRRPSACRSSATPTRSPRPAASSTRSPQFPERTHLVGVYALGKAQRLIALLRAAGHDGPIFLHGALRRLCDYYAARGIPLGELPDATLAKGRARDFAGQIVLGPPSAFEGPWIRRFADPLIAFASGWMQVRARARQRGVELPLVISDHCDWPELTATIAELDPARGLGHPRPRGSPRPLVHPPRPPRPPAPPRRLRGRGRRLMPRRILQHADDLRLAARPYPARPRPRAARHPRDPHRRRPRPSSSAPPTWPAPSASTRTASGRLAQAPPATAPAAYRPIHHALRAAAAAGRPVTVTVLETCAPADLAARKAHWQAAPRTARSPP